MRTHGYYAIALQLQAVGASEAAAGGSVIEWVARSSPLNKIVLLILIFFSVASWGIVFHKAWQFRRLERQTSSFLDVFQKCRFSRDMSCDFCKKTAHIIMILYTFVTAASLPRWCQSLEEFEGVAKSFEGVLKEFLFILGVFSTSSFK